MPGPLGGIKVVEFAGLAPGPFAGLVLADFGAEVIRIDRVDQKEPSLDVLTRGKRSIAINSKVPAGREVLLKLIGKADVLIDPFRPGALERLGLGPEVFLDEQNGSNKSLIYARLAGFPRDGIQKDMAGHDINYLASSGVLSMMPGEEKPSFPLNILADFAGGGLMCAIGILLALQARTRNFGRGQVVETDMVSGVRYISSFPLLHTLYPSSSPSPYFGVNEMRGKKALDGGAPFYAVYTCSDGRWMSVGCLEERFFNIFIDKFVSSLSEDFLRTQVTYHPCPASRTNVGNWPLLRSFLERGFKTKTRDEWAQIFHATDACTVPVLSPGEAAQRFSSPYPVPHPNLRKTPGGDGDMDKLTLAPGTHTVEILRELGFDEPNIQSLRAAGALGAALPKL